MRNAQAISLSEQETAQLVYFSNGKNLKVAERAKIILLAAKGLTNIEIAHQLGITRQKAARWRVRFVQLGMQGIEKEASRPGRKPKLNDEITKKVMAMLLSELSPNGKPYTQQDVADQLKISASSVSRIVKQNKNK